MTICFFTLKHSRGISDGFFFGITGHLGKSIIYINDLWPGFLKIKVCDQNRIVIMLDGLFKKRELLVHS